MQRSLRPNGSHRSAIPPVERRGLATLEFVLALPLLLFVMGLMIVFGTAATWKVRTQMNSRQAIWREFEERDGDQAGDPISFPAPSHMVERRLEQPLVSDDPFRNHAALRGPTLGGSVLVNDQQLDITAGSVTGHASVNRPFPLMREMPPGEFTMRRDHPILDGTRWQYINMDLGSNLQRRIPETVAGEQIVYSGLYDFQMQLQAPDLVQAYNEAALAVYNNPDRTDTLLPLTGGDPEIYDIVPARSPDFRPIISIGAYRSTIDALRGLSLRPTVCENNPQIVQRDHVEPLIERVEDVPQRMKDYYLRTYNAVLEREKELLEQGRPNRPELIPIMERQIALLEPFVP